MKKILSLISLILVFFTACNSEFGEVYDSHHSITPEITIEDDSQISETSTNITQNTTEETELKEVTYMLYASSSALEKLETMEYNVESVNVSQDPYKELISVEYIENINDVNAENFIEYLLFDENVELHYKRSVVPRNIEFAPTEKNEFFKKFNTSIHYSTSNNKIQVDINPYTNKISMYGDSSVSLYSSVDESEIITLDEATKKHMMRLCVYMVKRL